MISGQSTLLDYRHKIEGHLAMLLFSLIVAGSFSFGRIIARDIDPFALTAARFVLAAGLLGIVLALTGRIRLADHRQPWRYFILGGLFLFYFVLMFEALKTATSVSTSAIFTTMPLAAAVLDQALFRRASSGLVWAALLVGAAGALWVVFRGSWSTFTSFSVGRGELIFFVGTLLHAAYAVLVPRLRRGEPLYATTLGVSTAAALILVVFFWPSIAATDWASLTIYVWAVLAYLAVMATLGTFSLIAIAANRLTSAKVTAYTYLTPFWVICLEVALGNGLPGFAVLMGGIPIALALLLLLFENK